VSRATLLEQRRLWACKPVLARVYAPWFRALVEVAPRGGRVLEVGAGAGFLSAYARESRPDLRWIAADLIPASWNDLSADAQRLPFPDQCSDAILALDVLHHLADPAAFFSEASRVLRPDGRLALIEPWITPFSFPIYRWVHQEDCRLRSDPWDPFERTRGKPKPAFDGDAAVPWRLVRSTSAERWERLGFRQPDVATMNAFAYLLSLGFRETSLLPIRWVRPLLRFDELAGLLAPVLALRARLVWARHPRHDQKTRPIDD
jgi:SAM-dependent methyltransferase